MSDAIEQSKNTAITESSIKEPPTTKLGILKELGPGLIVAGAIVGSGELIATTATGAEAGFWLLWLIIIGCIIKVFVQVEMGRMTITSGQTTLQALSHIPGPRYKKSNWIIWLWLIMFTVGIGQLGGIVGGVGQALSISVPITDNGHLANEYYETKTKLTVQLHEKTHKLEIAEAAEEKDKLVKEVAAIQEQLNAYENTAPTSDNKSATKAVKANDQYIWAAIIAVITAALLLIGRYDLIQNVATGLVALFTLMSITNIIMLQTHPSWAISWQDIVNGLSFQLPPAREGLTPLATALATFGIIGVGAGELVFYPYWCLEKGYASYIGPKNDTKEWEARAKGWMRVLRWDAWCSMIVYTSSTIIFYLLGAAILGRLHLIPSGTEMIRTLGVMYEPVFGKSAESLFLFGAFAVLYSTFFVSNASKARVLTDAVRVIGLRPDTECARIIWIKSLSVAFPLLCLFVYICLPKPKLLVLAAGLSQSILLPVLAFSTIYFRYRRCDKRLTPGKAWDVMLWISAIGMLVVGVWIALTVLFPELKA